MHFHSALAAALLTLSACNCKPTCFDTPVMGPGEINHNPGLVGRPYTIHLPVPGNSSSCGPVTFASSVTVRLVDAANAPVMVAVTPMPLNGGSEPAAVTFTPSLPGAYHLSARFDPGFGLVQTDVIIAADRSDAGTNTRFVPYECARWDQAGEATLCIAPDAGSLGVIVDGGVTATVPAYDFAYAPGLGGVWVMAPGDGATFDFLQFHQLDAGVLTLVDQQRIDDPQAMTCPTGLCTPFAYAIFDARVLSRGSEALYLLPPNYGYAALSGAAITLDRQTDSSNQLPAQPFAQWGPGQAVVVAGPVSFGVDVCTLPFDGGFTNCSSSAGTPAGATPEGVCFFNTSLGELDGLALPSVGSPVTTHLPISPPDLPGPWPAPDSAPRWTVPGGLVVLGSRNGDLALDFFTLELSDATWWGVDSRRIWKWKAATRELSWIDR